MADEKFTQLDCFRFKINKEKQRIRLAMQLSLSNPIPDDDEDKTPLKKVIDFSDEETMTYFRKENRNFPDILAKRVQYHLKQWKCKCEGEELGIIEFLEKYAKDV